MNLDRDYCSRENILKPNSKYLDFYTLGCLKGEVWEYKKINIQAHLPAAELF